MGKYSLTEMVVFAVVLIGILAIAVIAANAMGVVIPTWVVNMLWVVVIVVVAVFAIKFIAGHVGPKP
jgi:uncharacterized protein (DUF983 family)